MRVLLALLAFAIVAISRTPAVADSLPETEQYFEGTWTCKTDRGAFAIHNYRIELGDQWMTMHNRFEMPGGATGQFDEYYRYLPAAKAWDVVAFGSDGTMAIGGSTGWAGTTWRFTGTQTAAGGEKVPWRMTYTRYGTSKFERTLELKAGNNSWARNSAETCERR